MHDFEKMKLKCPWLLINGNCAATLVTEVKCSEAHCAPLYWAKQVETDFMEDQSLRLAIMGKEDHVEKI